MLTGQDVLLRPPLTEDWQLLFRLRNDAALQTGLMALPRANSSRRVEEWVEGVLNDPESLFFVLAERSTGAGVGFVQLRRMNLVHGTGELGVCLDSSARGKGYAPEAIALLEGHARHVFRTRKVVLQVLSSNERAVACYEKCGYTQAGLLREHFYHAGQYHDVLIMEHMLEGAS